MALVTTSFSRTFASRNTGVQKVTSLVRAALRYNWVGGGGGMGGLTARDPYRCPSSEKTDLNESEVGMKADPDRNRWTKRRTGLIPGGFWGVGGWEM